MSGRILFAVPALVAGCYYLLALAAALRKSVRRSVAGGEARQGVSILKPIYGWDDRLAAAIASHARQDYPEFELLLGVRSDDTRALAEIWKSQQAFPGCAIRIIDVTTAMPNGKAGSLYDLAAAARYPLLVINDADICVEPDYLDQVTGPLKDSRIG